VSGRGFGYVLLALAVLLAGVGVWRGCVRLFGTLDDHWLPAIVPEDQRPAGAEVAVEQRRQEVAAARVAGDAEKVRAAEERLRSAEEQRTGRAATWEKVVSRSYKLEGVIAVGGLLTAAWLGRMGGGVCDQVTRPSTLPHLTGPRTQPSDLCPRRSGTSGRPRPASVLPAPRNCTRWRIGQTGAVPVSS
jgi:hypothetical protein